MEVADLKNISELISQTKAKARESPFGFRNLLKAVTSLCVQCGCPFLHN
jgi:hypothetical protein